MESREDIALDRLEVTALAALLPVFVTIASGVVGAGIAQAQVAFILSGGTALLVDFSHLAVVRTGRQGSSPLRVAGLVAGACCVMTALLVLAPSSLLSGAARSAVLGAGVLAAALLCPALPGARGSTRDVVWRLLMAAIAGSTGVTWPGVVILALMAVAWWTASCMLFHDRPSLVSDGTAEVPDDQAGRITPHGTVGPGI